jgi:4-amino-4-deoxy-L-arabinose transferase-like glycosyltransferase
MTAVLETRADPTTRGEGLTATRTTRRSPRRSWRQGDRPAWSLPARIAVFALAAAIYIWNLSSVGMANTFYAAAVKSGTESWKAFFFGSIDPANFITVDKPPASLWVMELSARIFGFSSWSMLLPQAIAGVLTVMMLYHLVRKWAGELAAVLASLAMCLTPVAVVIFRFNDPDAFLTLLLVLAAWACWSAIETAKTSRLVLCGALVGLAFITKTLEAFIVVPAFAIAFLVCGKTPLRRRILQGLAGALALVVSSSWWVAIVELWPASSRPYIGGSTNNSELNLIFGYNGFQRIFGSGGPGGSAINFGGSPGLLRMFNAEVGGQIAWLIPLAIISLALGLCVTRREPRTGSRRAGYVMWGAWLLMFMATFSTAKGIFHPYYVVVMAPAISALAGGGTVLMWRMGRRSVAGALALPACVIATTVFAWVLLARTPGYYPWLGPTDVAVGVLSAAALFLSMRSLIRVRYVVAVGAVLSALAVLAAPAAYSATTVVHGTSEVNATAGPAVTTSGGTGAGGPGAGAPGSFGTGGPGAGAPGAGRAGGGGPGGPGFAAGGAAGLGVPQGAGSRNRGLPPGGSGSDRGAPSALGVPVGGGSGSSAHTVNKALVTFLEKHQGSARYLVAVDGSMTSAPIIIDTGKAVMTMGGFNGSDPYPSLSQFEKLVATGQVRYVLVGSQLAGASGPDGNSSITAIERWVHEHGTVVPASSYGAGSSNSRSGDGSQTLYYVDSAA